LGDDETMPAADDVAFILWPFMLALPCVLDLLLVFLWRLPTNILTVIQSRTRLFIRQCLSRRHRSGFVIAFRYTFATVSLTTILLFQLKVAKCCSWAVFQTKAATRHVCPQ
jgi:hypothetical protein